MTSIALPRGPGAPSSPEAEQTLPRRESYRRRIWRGRQAQKGSLARFGHREEAAGRLRDDLARLEVLERALEVEVFPGLLDRAAPADERPFDRGGPDVAHEQLARPVNPAGIVDSRARQHLVEIRRDDPAVSAVGWPLEALGDDDGREHLAPAAKRAHAQADVVVGAAAKALVESAAGFGIPELLERGDERLERRGQRGIVGHALPIGCRRPRRSTSGGAASRRSAGLSSCQAPWPRRPSASAVTRRATTGAWPRVPPPLPSSPHPG